MKRALIILSLILAGGCSMKVSRPMLKFFLAGSNKVRVGATYADSCRNVRGLPYVQGGTEMQVLDIFYADDAVRRNAVLVDIHGGFYVAGRRETNTPFASVFLREGYDVVLVEYRHNNGSTIDVSHELADCASALDYLARNADSLGLNRDRMFLTGDSAGGHLVLYMAEGSADKSLPVHPEEFVPAGVMLNCPAYNYGSYGKSEGFTKGALKYYIGPRYADDSWMQSMSPRTYFSSYTGPLLVSTCTRDFIRGESLLVKADADSLGRALTFVDIASDDRRVSHVHNVIAVNLPESREVNDAMLEFMEGLL